MRTLVTFRSSAFNTSEPQPYFINANSFGLRIAEARHRAVCAERVHVVVSRHSEISNVRWNDQRDFDAAREELGTATP